MVKENVPEKIKIAEIFISVSLIFLSTKQTVSHTLKAHGGISTQYVIPKCNCISELFVGFEDT